MIAVWIGFLVLVLSLLALDLGVIHKKSREMPMKEALAWVGFWVGLALVFNVFIYFLYEYQLFGSIPLMEDHSGRKAALKFFTGYLVEKSLSMDNIFVFLLIFQYFRVPLKYQHRVLFWGILLAVILRGVMIGFGVTLLNQFQWMFYVFGVLLIFTAARMPAAEQESINPDRNLFVRAVKALIPVTMQHHEERFFVRQDERWMATPLFLALILVETSDIVFAVDSIPAILSITRDTFLVYTSNIFAILGLRSMYFALAVAVSQFRYLSICLMFILGFIGVKMILTHHYPIPIEVSMGVIVGILALGGVASHLDKRGEGTRMFQPIAEGARTLARLTQYGGRRIVTLVVGTTVLMVGVVLIFTPGPALVVIPAGLAILAMEFAWARWLLRRIKAQWKDLSDKLPQSLKDKLKRDSNQS
ncbi:TerC/Alx family metal homeostasis membrane protein [Nitrospina gracilis]|uniref:TerC/Alx family metal homeostasis membrane protein n=1 Tax=Nitrospina gracilis TaxID=35801 RepID=UPI001EFF64BF|nr:TerC/Alx family metal homeostasis membrane protein [Nitrospina gracilis]MCF8721814.1 tellurite resistance protein TerC [Nitrospina gracilis Nb-211]